MAEKIFKELKKLDPENVNCHIKLAEIYREKGLRFQALDSLTLALKLDSKNLQANKLYYKILKESGSSFSTLKRALENILEIEISPEVYYELGNLLYYNRQYDECLDVCSKILKFYRRGEIIQKTRQLYAKAKKYKLEEEEKKRKDLRERKEKEGLAEGMVILPRELWPLKRFVGMEDLKRQVLYIYQRIKLEEERKKIIGINSTLKEGHHFVITGNPGTGKTSVAKALAEVFANMGLTKENKLVVAERKNLVGQYIGLTEKNTREKIEEAIGGVLFIDEACNLYREESPRDFGKEAIDVLIKEMEDRRNSLMVIMAGYKTEMEFLLNSNQGFRSRINTIINFPDYDNEELLEIFKKMCKDFDMIIDDKGLEALEKHLENLPSRNKKGFGNGREIRNIFEKFVEAQNNRIGKMLEDNMELPKEELMKITVEDILAIASS